MKTNANKGSPTDDLQGDERWQLVGRIAASPPFRKSSRLRELLEYIAERTLHGHSDELTEHEIGEALYGKASDYSPLEDSTVRVYMRQLRLRLHEYFDSIGRAETLVLEIPKGAYVPVFRSARETPEAVEKSLPQEPVAHSNFALLIPWFLCVLLAVVCALQWHKLASNRNAIAPLQETKPPWPFSQLLDTERITHVVIADGSFGLMNVIAGKQWTLEDYLKPDFFQASLGLSCSKNQERVNDYIAHSALTGRADVVIVASILTLAGTFRDRISIDSARDIKLRDLEKGNYIFLGDQGSIPWVALFQNQLNFKQSLGQGNERSKSYLNANPRPGELKIYAGLGETGTTGDEYSDIALVPSGSQGGSALIIRGTQQEGTEAAGSFLADPEGRRKLRQALGLSSDPKEKFWFEALIRAKVIEGVPASESVVATRIIH